MDWLNNFFFFNENWFLQFTIFYILYLVIFTISLYFSLFYVFLIFFIFGLFLAYFNLELFTAFLWLTECAIIFISILLLFYLNVFEIKNKINFLNYSYKYYNILFIFVFLNLTFFNEVESINYEFIKLNYLNDDYYEALFNFLITDIFNFFISYYSINSYELCLLGFLLLIGSLVCVNLNKFHVNSKLNNYYDFLILFDFFKDFINFSFMRKQNLVDQTIYISSIRFFVKK